MSSPTTPVMTAAMSSTIAESVTTPRGDAKIPAKHVRALRIWLAGIALLIVAMILVGGATGSPIRASPSPSGSRSWARSRRSATPTGRTAFAAYQKIPEYTELKRGMSLDEFKTIYWWEWAHRFLGRLIGVAFLVPFVGLLDRRLYPACAAAAAASACSCSAAFRARVGWYMVKSGLVERTDVSQYRLAAHFGMALVDSRLHALAPVRAWRERPRALGAAVVAPAWVAGARARADLPADAGRRAGRGARCRHGLQHLAADRRRLRADGPRRSLALVSQPVREPAHRAVRPPHARLCRGAGRARPARLARA